MRWNRVGAVWIGVGIALVSAVAAGWTYRDRLPRLVFPASVAQGSVEPGVDSHDHDHEHDHGTVEAVVLGDQARKNLGLKVGPVESRDYWRTISVPGVVVERPGHSHRKVTAQLTGLIKELYIHPSQVVRPGDVLAELELTGDALATSQADLLAVVRDREINARELARVSDLVADGSVPAKNKVALEYDRERLKSQWESKIQALQVLGLSGEQIDLIQKERKLLREFTVRVPPISSEERSHVDDAQFDPARRRLPLATPKAAPVEFGKPAAQPASPPAAQGAAPPTAAPHAAAHGKPELPAVVPAGEVDWVYTVESIGVFPGKRVQIGDELCSLAFHVTLYIEGQAFEKEGEKIAAAMMQRWPVEASFEVGAEPLVRGPLTILYLDDVVDPQAHTFRFFVPLANEVLHDSRGPQGEMYRSWRFKPGQKVVLKVPTEKIENALVLPVEAVVREGPDAYVFRVNGSKLERQAVHVRFTGGGEAVLDDDGSLFPGDVVAMNNAYQLNLALRKAAGGAAVDPHAGHNH